jgi:hypothetical protein
MLEGARGKPTARDSSRRGCSSLPLSTNNLPQILVEEANVQWIDSPVTVSRFCSLKRSQES